jgi:hypothetical protein
MLATFNPSVSRTVRVIFKGDNAPIQITEEMAEAFKSSGNWITLQDPVTQEILYDGAKSEIKRLEHANLAKMAKEYSTKRWICEFGHRHALNDACKCMERYTCPPGYFAAKFWELKRDLGVYPQDLQEIERMEIARKATDDWCDDKESSRFKFQ